MLSYDICKKLKEIGFPQELKEGDWYFAMESDISGFEKIGEKYLIHSDCHFEHYAYPKLNDKPSKVENGSIVDLVYAKIPTLSELIEVCGDDFDSLERVEFMDLETKEKHNEWFVKPVEVLHDKFPGAIKYMIGQTPEEAVANLWTKLHEK